MKFLTRSIILILILLLSVSIVFSQEDVLRPKGKPGGYDYTFDRNPFIIGFEGGINYNMYNQTLAWDDNYYEERGIPNHPTVFDGIESANGISLHFGMLLDVPINSTLGLQARISYDMKNYGTTSSGYDWAYWWDIQGYTQENMDLDVDVTSSYLTFTPLLRINANDNLFFTVGPTFHFLMGDIETTWTPTVRSDRLATLDQFQFWNRPGGDGQSTAEFKTSTADPDEQAFSTRVGIEAGVGYKIPIAKSIYLVPQGRFQYMFTKQMEDTGWYDLQTLEVFQTTTDKMLHSLQFALAIWFEL